MLRSRLTFPILLLIFYLSNGYPTAFAQGIYQPSDTTQVVFLGTGTPNPDPEHSGNSVAIIVNNVPYIVDFGPGLIRQFSGICSYYGGEFEGLHISQIKRAFLTHLHSDHTTGYPDLILTPWVVGRDEPLEVYGPEGIVKMTENILEAYREDISMRLYGLEPANNQGWRVSTHEIRPGIVYQDSNVTVEAFPVVHGSWPEVYGFKFTTLDRTIAISGDCMPCESLVEACRGVDILIHEVYSHEKYQERNAFWKSYHAQFHTSTHELAEIANQVKPGLLILYHQLYWGSTDEDLVREVKESYNGEVVSARDLDLY